MFGTRADLVVDLTYLVTMAAPWITWLSMRRAHARQHDLHRWMQVVLLAVCVSAVIALEVHIRLSGGSGVLLAQSAAGRTGLARVLLTAHISCAVATYAVWAWLAVSSWRRFGAALPGSFTRRHRSTGRWIFGGLCFTAASATGMYAVAFVL